MERYFWIVVGPALFLTMAMLYHPFVADDAYIVGRYALNAADGHGLVYNVGERVSALTSPLHALVVTGFALVFDDPVPVARSLLLFLPIIGWAIALRMLVLTPVQVGLLTAFALTSPFLAFWSVGGLETPILALIMTVFTVVLARIWQRNAADNRDAVILGALCGLAFLTRHDSLIVTLPPLLALAYHRLDLPGVRWGAITALAIAGAWLIPAMLYYGDPLPTSLYVKTGDTSRPLEDSVTMTANFILLSGLAFLLPVLKVGRVPTGDCRRCLRLGLLFVAGLLTAYALLTSGKHMMFGYRFYVPYLLPLGIVLALMVPERPALQHRVAPFAFLTLSIATGAWVHFGSINPQPLRVVGAPTLEYYNISPRQYGMFMEALQEDAAVLKADAAKRIDTQPTVFLYTGGTGYWLRDFYVFESLVSYRHHCGKTLIAQLIAADYVQQIGMLPFNKDLEYIASRRHPSEKAQHIGETELFFEMDTYIRYLSNPAVARLTLPTQVGGHCSEAENFAMLDDPER